MDARRSTSRNRKKQQEEEHSQEESIPPAIETTADEDTSTLDIGACCLCHCSLDYSDKAAFSKEARSEDYNDDEGSTDSFYYRKQDPYLPTALEDANNALVYCDSCPRLYHQQCHFIPVIHLQASKPWECLICTVQKQCLHQSSLKSNKKKSKVEPYPYEDMFLSPPVATARTHEIRWECDPRVIAMKAILCDRELNTKFPKMFATTITKYKRAITALDAIGSSKRNRDHFLSKTSQELVQSVVTVAVAKRRIRSIFQDLEHVRCAEYPRRQWQTLLSWVQQRTLQQHEFVTRTMFPFGTDHPRRWAPVTPEYKPQETAAQIPSQITISQPETPTRRSTRSSPKVEPRPATSHPKDDGSFSLNALECSVCLNGEASDENDMILCDGHQCFRAYHANCVHPAISKEVLEDEHANWFCPYCQSLADSLHTIQRVTADADEWEQRRETRANEDHDGSLASWGGPDDVFPETDWEYRTALRLKEGERDHNTQLLLMRMLGMEADAKALGGEVDDDDNIEEDGHFDMYSYEEERKKKKEEATGSELSSDNSSQATLQELSSVELAIDKHELAALKSDGGSSWVDGEESSDRGIGRRLRARNVPNDSDPNSGDDPGKMSSKNILNGKRKRRRVDYRKLNDVIFGDADEKERVKLDDGEDFVSTMKADHSADESSGSDDSE